MVLSFRVLSLSVVLAWLWLANNAYAQMYGADMVSSEWKVSANPFACSLTHNIPVFGKAVFSRKAGGADLFYLESAGKVVFPVGVAGAETLPPQWRNDLVPVPLGAFSVVAGNQPININPTQAAPIIAQLTAGMNVMYSSQPIINGSSTPSIIRVVLNAKNFAAGYKAYQKCIGDIIPYSFAQVARTTINYAEKPDGLTPANKAELSKVARYVKADSNVVGVFVDGHSDNSAGSAEASEAISKQEAEWITAYLVEQGVAADKITTRWHGDKFVIADNKIAAGRAKNRRVTVRLEDEAAHKEFMKKEEEKRKADEKADEKASAQNTAVDHKKTDAGTAENTSASSKGKMTPEEISRMVEGYDLKNPGKQP